MKELRIDILSDTVLKDADAICFTSNGIVKASGELVMGAGVAKQFKEKFGVVIATNAGTLVKRNGNICQWVAIHFAKHPAHIVAFPTKYHWKDPSDLELVKKSAKELMALVDKLGWTKVYLPRPGTGLGNLQWSVVKSELEKILDDRVIITYL